MLPVTVPIQVVARKEEPVLEEKHAMPLSVARRVDGEESRSQLPRPFAIEDDVRPGLRRQLVAMNDAPALEVFCKTLSVGHVVSMRQEDVADAAKRFQLLHQRHDELR